MATYTTKPQARILQDSISAAGHRLTTMEVTFHRFVLAEFNTHRVFSRNSASSRAIPGHLQRQRVLETPAMPAEWPSKRSGMQGGATLPEEIQSDCDAIWDDAAHAAVYAAEKLDDLGVHKSVTNRLIEPFLWHTVIVTSTEWDNFFHQRDSKQAQPEIAEPASLMRQVYDDSEPAELRDDEWHLPLVFIDNDDIAALNDYGLEHDLKGYELLKRVSVARCARVSYLNHDGDRNVEDDIALYNKLETYGHWSPFEHVAKPCVGKYKQKYEDKYPNWLESTGHTHLGNFTGWDQYRHMVETNNA